MKNKILSRLIAIVFAMAVFASCSKENSIIQPDDSVSNTEISGKLGPVYSSGVFGQLFPAPAFAVIKIYDEAGFFSAMIPVNADGTFRSGFIRPGVYGMQIAYIPVGMGDDSKLFYFNVDIVKVLADEYSDLGKIILP